MYPYASDAVDSLYDAVLRLKTREECYAFFDDLCTVKEVSEMAKRLCAARLLDGNAVYTEVNEQTGLSTATISRISRCLKYGSDGYRDVLRRLEEKGIDLPPSSPDESEKGDNG